MKLQAAFSLAAAVVLTSSTAFAAPARDSSETSTSNVPQVEFINQQVRQVWEEYQVAPSPKATEGEWVRRVYLDILGRIPSVQELRAFTKSNEPDKRNKLVSSLLYDEKYTEEYARNWTTIWTNILIGRSGGTDDDDLASRAGMQKYLRDAFARNKPYDQMVRELVTATGGGAPGGKNFNGASNFLIDKLEEDAALATAATSRIFLGKQVQCTQCHNHPFNEWKQNQFWELNAFFRQTRALKTYQPGSNDVESAELINEDFAGEGGDPSEAEIYYELRNGLLKVAYPVFTDGTEIPRSGYLDEVNRRDELARLIVGSPDMDKAIVNRMWSHFLGYGFTKPIDDMGPHNGPTHPALLDYLGQQFREQSHNYKELIRWIVLSEPYSLSSRTTSRNEQDDPMLGETPKFSHFYLRQMSAEQLYESLLVATQAHKTRGSYEEQERLKTEWLDQFVIAFGNDEGLETTTFNGTIPQALMMMNGDLIKKAVSDQQGGFLWTLANSDLRPSQMVDYLFEAGLSRKPKDKEVRVANQLLAARGGNTVAALQDLWWAVLNSNEFIIIH